MPLTPLTGDGRPGSTDKPRASFSGWVSAKGDAQPADHDASPDATPTGPPLRRKMTSSSSSSSTESSPKSAAGTTVASRWMSAISQRFVLPHTAASSPVTVDDELFNLDIEAALFPPQAPANKDAFSAAAFKNLQTTATGLLTRMQKAYRERVVAARDLEAERGAQRDELDEAVTRAQHLKLQLEGMARTVQEQEHAMQQLMDGLVAERKARAGGGGGVPAIAEGSVASEDLGIDEDRYRTRTWRTSGGTVKSVGSFDDTDEESAESESVFSRSRSPTLPQGPLDAASLADGPAPPHARLRSLVAKPKPEKNTFQKLFKGFAGDAGDAGFSQDCKGQDATVAWHTVSLLRDENKQLKQRVGQLEVAVEGALDLVKGVGLP